LLFFNLSHFNNLIYRVDPQILKIHLNHPTFDKAIQLLGENFSNTLTFASEPKRLKYQHSKYP